MGLALFIDFIAILIGLWFVVKKILGIYQDEDENIWLKLGHSLDAFRYLMLTISFVITEHTMVVGAVEAINKFNIPPFAGGVLILVAVAFSVAVASAILTILVIAERSLARRAKKQKTKTAATVTLATTALIDAFTIYAGIIVFLNILNSYAVEAVVMKSNLTKKSSYEVTNAYLVGQQKKRVKEIERRIQTLGKKIENGMLPLSEKGLSAKKTLEGWCASKNKDCPTQRAILNQEKLKAIAEAEQKLDKLVAQKEAALRGVAEAQNRVTAGETHREKRLEEKKQSSKMSNEEIREIALNFAVFLPLLNIFVSVLRSILVNEVHESEEIIEIKEPEESNQLQISEIEDKSREEAKVPEESEESEEEKLRGMVFNAMYNYAYSRGIRITSKGELGKDISLPRDRIREKLIEIYPDTKIGNSKLQSLIASLKADIKLKLYRDYLEVRANEEGINREEMIRRISKSAA